ncbi:MAG: hypothetical protein QNJ40_02240 [Xanthomonadales bacterium]|nr:hypothetical protein [Xanthomonadales bacterium]
MRILFSLILFFTATAVMAEGCDKPYKVEIPDGATATKEDMVTTQKAVKAYMAEADVYLGCLEEEQSKLATAILSEEALAEASAKWSRRHNAMVDEMHGVGDEFNAAVRAYKAAQ